MGIWVKQGSRYENKLNNGISHVTEHMVFNKNNSNNKEIKKCFERLNDFGIVCNASTTKEHTKFYFECMSAGIDVCLDTILAMINNRTFDEDIFNNEKQVIKRELSSFYSSFNQIGERTGQALYGDYDIGKLVLGSYENLENLAVSSVEKLVESAYTPENSSLVIIGNIEYEDMKDIIYKKFSSWEDKKSNLFKETIDQEPGVYYDNSKNTDNNVMSVGFRIPSYSMEDGIRIELLSLILTDPVLSKRLPYELREKRAMTYVMGGFVNQYEEVITLGITSVFEKNNTNEVLRIIINEINKLKKEGVLGEEL